MTIEGHTGLDSTRSVSCIVRQPKSPFVIFIFPLPCRGPSEPLRMCLFCIPTVALACCSWRLSVSLLECWLLVLTFGRVSTNNRRLTWVSVCSEDGTFHTTKYNPYSQAQWKQPELAVWCKLRMWFQFLGCGHCCRLLRFPFPEVSSS